MLWSFLFFSVHAIGWAFAEILVLWLAILITIILFARISKPAAWLLVPYISWVSFATILTFTIWQLNR
jgi:tryptophan-rich sensory protein